MPSPLQSLKALAKRQPYYIAAVACLGLGVFLHWFLFLAFLCALRPLHEEIERLREQLHAAGSEPPAAAAAAARTRPASAAR
jgi:hypothetical protein